MARDECWDALKEHARQNHKERVAKNPDRIEYAIRQLEAHNIEYVLKNDATGHFRCRRNTAKLRRGSIGKPQNEVNSMKIPEKIKIGGKTYTVEITSKMDLGINNVSAEILYGDLIIRVSPQATAKMEADFIHEMVHAIYFGLGYRDHDEKRVDELANALHSVIVDNPDVFAPAEVGRHES